MHILHYIASTVVCGVDKSIGTEITIFILLDAHTRLSAHQKINPLFHKNIRFLDTLIDAHPTSKKRIYGKIFHYTGFQLHVHVCIFLPSGNFFHQLHNA